MVGPERAAVRAAPCRGPRFDGATFSEGHWHAMASGAAHRDARCLAGYDDEGAAVAVVTVWPAGEGRPGLIEPMGVHRGRGHGTAITVAAVAARRELGSSSALVCTQSANRAAVAPTGRRASGRAPRSTTGTGSADAP